MKRHLIASLVFCGLVGPADLIAQEDKTGQDQPTPAATIPKNNQRDPSMPVATYGDARFRFGNWITSLCFSPDGKLLASSSYYWGTALWDAQTGKLIRHFPSSHQDRCQATFSPDGKLLVVACIDLHVWKVATGELLYEIKNAGQEVRHNRRVQFTRDGKHFLAVGIGEVLFIETKTGRTVHEIKTGGRLHGLNGVALSPDGSRAILGTYQLLEEPAEGVVPQAVYAVKTFDLTTGKEILPRPPQEHFGAWVKSIQFTPDGRSLVVVTGKGHFNQTFQLLDPQTFKLQRVLKTEGIVSSHDCTPDGKLLAVGGDNTSKYFIDLFDPASDKRIRRWQAATSRIGKGIVLAFSPDGKTIASATDKNPMVKLWDTATGKERFPHDEGGAAPVRRMAILGDDRTLVTQDRRYRVIRRDLKTGRVTRDRVWPLPGSSDSMALSSQGGELLGSGLSGIGNEPQLKGSQLMADVARHDDNLLAEARISADGNRVAVLFRPTRLNVYDRHTGKRLRQFGAAPYVTDWPRVSDMALSADGSRVVCSYGSDKQIWNVETGEELHPVPGGDYHFAPDGTLVIVDKHGALLWNVDEGKTIGVLNDKPHWMGTVAFSPDGKLMATGRGWGSSEVVLWDLATRKVIRVLRGTRGGVAALCFTPDGRKLYASDNSTLTVVWDLSND